VQPQHACPCGSGKPYGECCAPLHRGERGAATAEALMRSRYSAYVLKDGDYLRATWHTSTRPALLELADDTTRWLGLRILAAAQGGEGDEAGSVEFAADYAGGQLHERSRFVREGGRWRYLDGERLPPVKVGRNEPCPCGSGRKFKRCCG
jgi:SEC-C motif-containing protein